jgi:hypothetical protein
MDEAESVLARLARIEALDRDGAPAGSLLVELRALVAEAESWSRTEGGEEAESAALRLREALSPEAFQLS